MNFKNLYPNYQTFQTKIIDTIQQEYPNSDWCNYDKMLTSWENIYNWMFRSFNYRNLRYNATQTHYNIQNIFIEELPNFYIKQRLFLKDNFSKLDDITKLGGIEKITRTLTQNLTGTSKNTFKNSNLVSPQGFVSFTEDMPVSQAVVDQNDGSTDTTNNTSSNSDDEISRVNFLEKVIQVSEIKFGFFIKELIGKFDNIFQRFVVIDDGDEDLYLKLKLIFKDDPNIDPVFDDKLSQISFELNGIDNLLEIINNLNSNIDKKVDKDFNNVDLNIIVDSDKTNSIKVINNKLFSAGGSGGSYAGDGFSIAIDDKNTISSIGLKLKDNKYIKADDISDELNKVEVNKTNIETNKEDIQKINTNKLEEKDLDAKSIIKSEDGTYYTQSISHPNTKNYYYTTDIMNKDNLSDFVDSSKEGNILKVEGSKLSAVAPKPTQNKWKLILKPEDFDWQPNDFVYKYPHPVKPTSQYKLYFKIQKYFTVVGSIELPNFWVADKDTFKLTYFFKKVGLPPTNFQLDIFSQTINLVESETGKTQNISKSEFWIYELEDSIDPIPIPPLPSKPILNKKVYYDNLKIRWKRKNDDE